jgi:hypothetical protein
VIAISCCSFRALSHAAAKSAAARLRRMGLLRQRHDWAARASLCERCPLCVIRRGISYCGKPLLERLAREQNPGCGCPTHDKAKDPAEHCPVDLRYQPARRNADVCNCKWCAQQNRGTAQPSGVDFLS